MTKILISNGPFYFRKLTGNSWTPNIQEAVCFKHEKLAEKYAREKLMPLDGIRIVTVVLTFTEISSVELK